MRLVDLHTKGRRVHGLHASSGLTHRLTGTSFLSARNGKERTVVDVAELAYKPRTFWGLFLTELMHALVGCL